MPRRKQPVASPITENETISIQFGTTIATIYIVMASGMLMFVLGRDNSVDMTSKVLSAASFLASIVLFIFCTEFYTLAACYKHKNLVFGWIASICYGLAQTFFYIGVSFLILNLTQKMIAVAFLLGMIIAWFIYYFIRLKNVRDTDHIITRWIIRLAMLIMYSLPIIYFLRLRG